MNYVEQIEVLQEKKNRLLEEKERTSCLFTKYNKEYERFSNLSLEHLSFSSALRNLDDIYGDFCNTTNKFSATIFSLVSSSVIISLEFPGLSFTLSRGALFFIGCYMAEWLFYFRLKRKTMKENVDLYEFDVEQYDVQEQLTGNFSALLTVSSENNIIDDDSSKVYQHLETFTLKKTL